MTSSQPPFQLLARRLETLVFSGQLRSGEKLPSLRQLAEQYQLKNNTVQRALKVLQEKGLLRSIPGDGYYVARPEQPGRPGPDALAVIQHVSSDFDTVTYTSVALTGIQEEAIRRSLALNVHYGVLLDNRDDQLVGLLQQIGGGSRAVIMLGTFDFQMSAFDCPCPVVGISMHESYHNKVSVISLDPFAAAELAVDYFHERKIRKVSIFLQPADEQRVRLACFRARWDGELAVREYDSLEPLTPAELPDRYPADEGFLYAGGTLAEWHAKHFLAQTGQRLAAARAVLSIDGKSTFNPGRYEPMNNLVPDWKLAGKMAVGEALRRAGDPGSGALRQYLSVRFEPTEIIGE